MAHPMREIAEQGGPEAVGLVAALMDQSARERESIERSVLASTERQRDAWRERAIAAEEHLATIRERLLALLDPPIAAEQLRAYAADPFSIEGSSD